MRFDDGDSAYLSWTPGSAGDRKTWTVSFWMKRGNLTTGFYPAIFSADIGGSRSGIRFEGDANDRLSFWEGNSSWTLTTTRIFRDPSAWYHIVGKFDSTPATPSSSSIALYINGEQVTDFDTENYPAQDFETAINDDVSHSIGREDDASGRYFDGYLAEFYFIDGTALDASSFGETDSATGQWKPIDASDLTFGTNGFYQKYSSTELANSFTDSSAGIDTFTSTGTTSWTAPTGVTSVEYLVVAGGGGGGINRGGGGGGGGYLAGTLSVTPSTSYTVTVGDGGTGSSSDQGDDGDDSVFSSITATGGGGGGYSAATEDGRAGGSGGGGGGVSSGGAGTTGQGNDGGGGDHNESSGGGGGASAAGVAGSGSTAGDGGDGLANSITGSSVTYAGGGGGGTYQGTAGSGGAGGGGNGGGAGAGSGVGSPGTDGLGGGGGGAGYGATGGNGGNGGSGIVILKYQPGTGFHTITANGDVTNTRAESKVGDSSIKFDGTGDYLTIPDSSDWDFGDNDFTIEFWMNTDVISADGSIGLITKGDNGSYFAWGVFRVTDAIKLYAGNSANDGWEFTEDMVTGLSAGTWYHIAIVRNGDDYTGYKDGVVDQTFTNSHTLIETSLGVSIGLQYTGYAFDGYLDEIRISNTARYTSGFTPSTTEFTADSNTKLLIHSDWNGGIGGDSSGNDNDFTPTNLVATDQMVDSPTNNFATLSPIAANDDGLSCTILTEGNLKIPPSSSATRHVRGATIDNSSLDDEKWYYEIYVGAADSFTVGYRNAQDGDDTPSVEFEQDGQYKVDSGNSGSATGTISDGDILGVLLDWSDTSAKTFAIYVNNSLVGSAKTFTANANGYNLYGRGSDASGNGGNLVYNFGSDSSFAGNKTAQGNQDSNGIGDFYYEPPTDYLALCSSNLPSPEIALPTDHFNTVLYTGTGSARAVTGTGFEPDWLWVKRRSGTGQSSHLVDSVRGVANAMASDGTWGDYASSVSSLDSDGFTLSGGAQAVNGSTETYVSWNWLAGGTAVSNTDGSITSSVSANPTAGFSIATYTGNNTAEATIGHGLSQTPDWVIIKDRDNDSTQWVHNPFGALGSNYYGYFTTGAFAADSSNVFWYSPTASVVKVSAHSEVNASSTAYIMYCFHSIPGYSKVGSYEGNDDVDGAFVYTGFRPAMVIIKVSSATSDWRMMDNKRDTYNPNDLLLFPSSYEAEAESSTYKIDFLSNGFKQRNTHAGLNDDETYIYLAFAKSPFKTSNAR